MRRVDPTSTPDDLAAEYLLGTLTPSEQHWVEAQMAVDPALRALVYAWQERLAPLCNAIAAVEPPASVLDRLNAQLDQDEKARTAQKTIFAAEGTWVALAAGVHIKVLASNEAEQGRSFLLRMEPGARLPAHRHPAVEECIMIEGDLTLGGVALSAGDYQRMSPGSRHPTGRTLAGCVAFIRTEAPKTPS